MLQESVIEQAQPYIGEELGNLESLAGPFMLVAAIIIFPFAITALNVSREGGDVKRRARSRRQFRFKSGKSMTALDDLADH